MEKKKFSMFFRYGVRILLNIHDKNPTYTTLISKDLDITYSHTFKILEELKKFGLVDIVKKGRINFVTLTDNGLELARHLTGAMQVLSKG